MQTIYKILIFLVFLSFGTLTAEAKSAEWQTRLPTLYSHFIGNTQNDLLSPVNSGQVVYLGITSSGASEYLWYPVLKSGSVKVSYTPRVIYSETRKEVYQANDDNSDIVVPAGTKLTFYYPNVGPKFNEHVWRGIADGTFTQITGEGNVASAKHPANYGGDWTLWNSQFTPFGTWYPNASMPSNSEDLFCDGSGLYGYYQGQKDIQHYYPSGDVFHPTDFNKYFATISNPHPWDSGLEPDHFFSFFSAPPYNFKFNQINENGRQI